MQCLSIWECGSWRGHFRKRCRPVGRFFAECLINGSIPLQEELTIFLQTSVDVISRRALKPRDTVIREEALAL